MDDQCRGVVTRYTITKTINPETGKRESMYQFRHDPCKRKGGSLNRYGYCWQHRDQGEYEEELESAYAQHTAVY